MQGIALRPYMGWAFSMELESDAMELVETPFHIENCALSERARAFLKDGRSRIAQVNCFDFVPSKYEQAWHVLSSLPRGKLCEWGSGLAIVVGLAEMLGYEACGIELDADLAATSRNLLATHGLSSPIFTGSCYEIETQADYYYVYSWPSQFESVQQHFLKATPPQSKLLLCYGQDDIRLRIKPSLP